MSGPIITPHEVKGFMGHVPTQPDRVFLVLDDTPSHEVLWEVDGYVIRDQVDNVEHWTIHLICPNCGNTLTIKSEKKQLQVSDEGLEVEEISCPWPGDFGQATCTFKAALEKPPANRRIVRDNNGVRRKVDAIFRRA